VRLLSLTRETFTCPVLGFLLCGERQAMAAETTMTSPDDATTRRAPTPVNIPEIPGFLNDGQWKVLMALMDTVVPAIRVQDPSQIHEHRDTSVIYLSNSEYSDTIAALRKAAWPLNHSSDILDAYLAERPSDNPLFNQTLRLILSNLPPKKQRELRYLLSFLRHFSPLPRVHNPLHAI
jgi:hypothetical protein